MIEEADAGGLLHALRNVAEARGDPQPKNLAAILDAAGLRLSVTPGQRKVV